MWTWLVLCANKEERCLLFWDSKFIYPFIPLLWSKEESKESEKENCLVFTFCKSLDPRGFTLHITSSRVKGGVFWPLHHSPNP
jgi:hypothetical protein